MASRRKPTHPSVEDQFDALYAELPQIECRGLCWDSCGPIPATAPELRRIRRAGYDITQPNHTPGVCPALTLFNRCAVREIRPLICRLWDVSEGMPCTFGCRPSDGRPLLTDKETYEIIARGYEIAGDHAEADKIRTMWADPQRAAVLTMKLREKRRDDDIAYAVMRRRAEQQPGGALYVLGRGRLSRQAPTSGANASPRPDAATGKGTP